jgi:MFS family permease
MQDLVGAFHLPGSSLSHLTSAVQFGFITGTLSFALLTISDRFSPSKVFFTCAIAGAISNAGIVTGNQNLTTLFIYRFAAGFFLAGIYPVGMKISSDYYEKGLGKALGILVGALVLGTSFPHLLKTLTGHLDWEYVVLLTSGFSIAGGSLILFFVPDGPYRKPSQHISLRAFYRVFKNQEVRSAAFGYFGHMWELYTFWAYIPLILLTYTKFHEEAALSVPFLSFLAIASGGLSCIAGGYFSIAYGSKKTASAALLSSGICCLISPLTFGLPASIFFAFLIFWGMAVVADSPQFSALVAQNAPEEHKGTALTIVNCIGFTITIVSIEVCNLLIGSINTNYIFLVLAIGPMLGLTAMYWPKVSTRNNSL